MSNPLSPPPSAGRLIDAQSLTSLHLRKWWVMVIALVVLVFIIGIFNGWLGVGVALVLTLAALGFFAKSILAALRWEQASLEVPTIPFLLGSNPEVIYRRMPRRAADFAEGGVRCTVVCEERATYRQGTDTRTDSAQVFEQTFTGSSTRIPTGTGQALEAEITLTIPAHTGAPSFDLGDNEVHWYIEAITVGPGLPADKQRFPILVGLELDPEQRNVMGDR